MKTKRSFDYYKNLLTELQQPFLQLPTIHGNPDNKILLIWPSSSEMYNILPSTTHADIKTPNNQYGCIMFDYDKYDQEQFWDQDTVEYISDYHYRMYEV